MWCKQQQQQNSSREPGFISSLSPAIVNINKRALSFPGDHSQPSVDAPV